MSDPGVPRAQAQVKLDGLIFEARSHKAAGKHLQDLYELKAGDELQNAPLTQMEKVWNDLPSKKPRFQPLDRFECDTGLELRRVFPSLFLHSSCAFMFRSHAPKLT